MIRKELYANGVKITTEQFSGIHDFLNMYENAPVSEAYACHTTANHLQDDEYDSSEKSFTGVKGYADAVEKLKNGVNVAAIKSARIAAETGTKRMIKKSVNGGRVSVPAYLSGSPACMRRSCRMPAKTELNVVVDTGVPAFVKAGQVTEAGKLVVKFITELEDRYNVNLHAITSTSFDGYRDAFVFGIKIKDAGKPFSAARVSFCLTSAAFQRVFSFLWRTRAAGVPYDYALGRSTSNDMETERKVIAAVYKNSVLLSINDIIRRGEAALPKVK